jgi:methylenetetrahydrofolate dehydrogenase (NADP+) / methenyltetrahydrofolate cyclohydrolase
MELIDGKKISEQILIELKAEVDALPVKPCVVFIRVGDDPASVSYVSKKQKVAADLGIESRLELRPNSITQDELFALIDKCNADKSVHGILVQAPLPSHISEKEVFNRVRPEKDVDGFNSANIGKLCQEDPDAFVACTPAGIIELLRYSNVDTAGKHVVVVGRSLIVGKPAALLMMQKATPGNSTVTVCHSRTENLPSIVKQADIIIAAIGRPEFITGDMVKEGAVVIDVGINRVEDASKKAGYRLVGDVDFNAVSKKASKITPVPGGVGPMTVTLLMKNTIKACKLSQKNIPKL